MADGRITLTDVMLGIDKHGLVDKLSDQCFKFLVGLILEANRIGFKNPFDLTVNQALAAGGGSSRQTLSSRRRSLARFKIDGKQLVKIKVGNHARNTTATYQIDYKLLCSQNGAWKGLEARPSNIIDGSLSAKVRQADGSLDGSLTILRSDQIREEEINPPNPPNEVTTSEGEGSEKASGSGGWVSPEDSEEDWITYLISIMCKPKEKFPPIDIVEKATWLVKHNDLELLEECYDAFQAIPISEVRNRPAFFMSMIEKRGGEVIR